MMQSTIINFVGHTFHFFAHYFLPPNPIPRSPGPLSYTSPRSATECKYLGMFSFRPEDVPNILQRVILGVQPSDMVGKLPCLPAHILFMCVRFVDHWNNSTLMEQFMNGVIKSIQQVMNIVSSK